MKTRLHANATTTPKTRALIQQSREPVVVLARRFGVSETTIYRWRKRDTVEDRSHARHNRGQATTPEDEAIIIELRRRAGLSLDDITEVMQRCVRPDLSRNSVYSALRRAGLSGRPARGKARAQPFEDAPFGFVHVDLKYLAKLKGRGEFAFVAIERATRFVHVEVLPNRDIETVAAAWTRFLDAFGHPVHTVLTDNGPEFTDRFKNGSKEGHRAPSLRPHLRRARRRASLRPTLHAPRQRHGRTLQPTPRRSHGRPTAGPRQQSAQNPFLKPCRTRGLHPRLRQTLQPHKIAMPRIQSAARYHN